MIINKAILAGLTTVSLCFAQGVTISGKVTDTGGTQIPGAVVRLEKGGQTATTGVDGSFSLTGNAVIIGHDTQVLPHTLSATAHNGILYVNVKEKSIVMIRAYSLQGQVVTSVQRAMEPGINPIALPLGKAGIYLYKVKSGSNEFILKSCSIARVSRSATRSSQGPSSMGLTKQAQKADVIDDVIAVAKSGYLNYRVNVTNSDTSGIEIEMIACQEPVTDIDSNTYQTVKIGNQVWMAENLRTTRLNDGTAISNVKLIAGWSILATPAYVLYNNTTNADSIKKFGVLYNWFVINTKKLAPAGWHVPTDAEWDTLQNFLIAKGYNWDETTTDNKIGKSLAARADWKTTTIDGTVGCDVRKNNRSGFSAMPGGSRYYDVNFNYIGQFGYWWSATAEDDAHAHYRLINCYLDYLDSYISVTSCGFSVRLVKD